MRTLFFPVALAALFSLLAGQCVFAASYTNAIAPNNAPFTYVEPSGKPAGFDVEAMNWIAQTMEFTVTHKPLAPAALLPALLAGDVDMVCSGLRITPEALGQAAFSRPYLIAGNVFAVRHESSFTDSDVMLGNKLLGVKRATSQAQWLARAHADGDGNYTLQYYDSVQEIFDDLLAGTLDAAAMVAEQAEAAIHKDGKPVIIVGDFGTVDFLGVATRPGNTVLLSLIDEGFRRLKTDPFWEELQEKHRVPGW